MLKCLYGQQDFSGFGISITSKNAFKPKEMDSDSFLPQNGIVTKVPAPATPNDVDHVMKDC